MKLPLQNSKSLINIIIFNFYFNNYLLINDALTNIKQKDCLPGLKRLFGYFFFKILKIKSNYEKPSERKKREREENIKRSKKIKSMRDYNT